MATRTLAAVVGSNMKDLRLLAGLTQGDMTVMGWTRDIVASLESGRRAFSLDDLFALGFLFRVGVSEFFVGDPESEVGVEGSAGITLGLVQSFFGAPAAVDDVQLTNHLVGIGQDVAEQAVLDYDPAPGIAHRLGLTRVALNRKAKRLWGRSVKDEYWERCGPRVDSKLSRRSLATVRGHVVRGLQKELRHGK